MLSRYKRSEDGFTLVELVVVLGLASLFSSLVFRFYFESNKSQTRLVSGLVLQNTIVAGVNKTMREIRSGTSFVVPALDESLPIAVFTDNENNHKTIFALENKTATEKEKTSIKDLFVYTTDNSLGAVSAFKAKNRKFLCSDVKSIKFRLTSARSVTADFVFQKNGKTFEIISEGALMNTGEIQ